MCLRYFFGALALRISIEIRDCLLARRRNSEFCLFSGVECSDEIYSAFQYSSVKSEQLCTTSNNNNNGVTNKTTIPTAAGGQGVEKLIPIVETVSEKKEQHTITTDITKPITVTANLFSNYTPTPTIAVVPPTSRPQTATTKIFANRTEDMNKGFLTFSDEEPGLTCKYTDLGGVETIFRYFTMQINVSILLFVV